MQYKLSMRSILLITILLLSIGLCVAQKQAPLQYDRVILKNHSQVKGKIIEVNDRKVLLEVDNAPLTIHKSKIASVYFQGKIISFLPPNIRIKNGVKTTGLDNRGYRLVPEKETSKRGFYNVTYTTFQFRGSGDLGYNEFGFGVSNTIGYQIDQYTGLGIGIGYHSNTTGIFAGNIVPVYVEYRGYLSDNKVSTYYSFAYGMSFGTRLENSLETSFSTKPGTYIYPAIGFKSGSDKSSIMVDIGLRFSEVTYSYVVRGFGIGTSNIEETIYNKGLVLRIGVML